MGFQLTLTVEFELPRPGKQAGRGEVGSLTFLYKPHQPDGTIQLKIATILAVQDKWSEAEEWAAKMVASNDVNRIETHYFFYLLAAKNYTRNDTASAISYCKKAAGGLRKRLGEQHEHYQYAILLLAFLYEAKNSPLEAEGCRALVSEDMRSLLLEFNSRQVLKNLTMLIHAVFSHDSTRNFELDFRATHLIVGIDFGMSCELINPVFKIWRY